MSKETELKQVSKDPSFIFPIKQEYFNRFDNLYNIRDDDENLTEEQRRQKRALLHELKKSASDLNEDEENEVDEEAPWDDQIEKRWWTFKESVPTIERIKELQTLQEKSV